MDDKFMPTSHDLTQKSYSQIEWLTYYRNVWLRNAVARRIDVETDKVMKETDSEQEVDLGDGSYGPVKVRLEMRKLIVKDSLALIAGIDALIAKLNNPEGTSTVLSDEELQVAEDMLTKPETPVAGAACTMPDGSAGTYTEIAGNLVCALPEEKTPEGTETPVTAENTPNEETPAEVAEVAPETETAQNEAVSEVTPEQETVQA